jgi:hypothetical protein
MHSIIDEVESYEVVPLQSSDQSFLGQEVLMLRQALKEKDIFENIIETLVAAQSDFEEDEEIYTDTEEEVRRLCSVLFQYVGTVHCCRTCWTGVDKPSVQQEADTKSYQGQAFASTYLQRQEESITTEQLASRVPAIDGEYVHSSQLHLHLPSQQPQDAAHSAHIEAAEAAQGIVAGSDDAPDTPVQADAGNSCATDSRDSPSADGSRDAEFKESKAAHHHAEGDTSSSSHISAVQAIR